MPIRTPPLYATGKWQVRSPFEVKSDVIYTCKAIRSIRDLKVRGVDPFETFYEPYEISRDRYEEDLTNLVNIVTLFSDNDAVLYIPDTFIESYPDTTTVPYSQIVLSIGLGAVPDTLALDDVKEKIEDIILTSIGVTADVREHQSGTPSQGVEQTEHEVLESNRKAKMEGNQSLYAQLLSCQAENEDLRGRIRDLEKIIVDSGILD